MRNFTRRRQLGLVVIILFLFLSTFFVLKNRFQAEINPPTNYSISGVIYATDTQKPLNADIILTPQEGDANQKPLVTRTTSWGFYRFENVAPTYRALTISAANYERAEATISNPSGQSKITFNYALTPGQGSESLQLVPTKANTPATFGAAYGSSVDFIPKNIVRAANDTYKETPFAGSFSMARPGSQTIDYPKPVGLEDGGQFPGQISNTSASYSPENGRYYIFGGLKSDGNPADEILSYDPGTKATTVAAHFAEPMVSVGSLYLPEKKAFLLAAEKKYVYATPTYFGDPTTRWYGQYFLFSPADNKLTPFETPAPPALHYSFLRVNNYALLFAETYNSTGGNGGTTNIFAINIPDIGKTYCGGLRPCGLARAHTLQTIARVGISPYFDQSQSKLYLLGGSTSDGQVSTKVEYFTISDNYTSTKIQRPQLNSLAADLPYPVAYAAFQPDDQNKSVFLYGGRINQTDSTAKIIEFNSTNQTASIYQVRETPYAFSNLPFAQHENSLTIFGSPHIQNFYSLMQFQPPNVYTVKTGQDDTLVLKKSFSSGQQNYYSGNSTTDLTFSLGNNYAASPDLPLTLVVENQNISFSSALSNGLITAWSINGQEQVISPSNPSPSALGNLGVPTAEAATGQTVVSPGSIINIHTSRGVTQLTDNPATVPLKIIRYNYLVVCSSSSVIFSLITNRDAHGSAQISPSSDFPPDETLIQEPNSYGDIAMFFKFREIPFSLQELNFKLNAWDDSEPIQVVSVRGKFSIDCPVTIDEDSVKADTSKSLTDAYISWQTVNLEDVEFDVPIPSASSGVIYWSEDKYFQNEEDIEQLTFEEIQSSYKASLEGLLPYHTYFFRIEAYLPGHALEPYYLTDTYGSWVTMPCSDGLDNLTWTSTSTSASFQWNRIKDFAVGLFGYGIVNQGDWHTQNFYRYENELKIDNLEPARDYKYEIAVAGSECIIATGVFHTKGLFDVSVTVTPDANNQDNFLVTVKSNDTRPIEKVELQLFDTLGTSDPADDEAVETNWQILPDPGPDIKMHQGILSNGSCAYQLEGEEQHTYRLDYAAWSQGAQKSGQSLFDLKTDCVQELNIHEPTYDCTGTNNKVFLSWDTAEQPALGTLSYGEELPYTTVVGQNELKATQQVVLDTLPKDETYHYQVEAYLNAEAKDGVSSDDLTFTSCPSFFKNINIYPYTRKVDITWQTISSSIDTVEYGPAEEYGKTQAAINFNENKYHKITIENLDPSVNYHFRFRAVKQIDQTEEISDDDTFETEPELLKFDFNAAQPVYGPFDLGAYGSFKQTNGPAVLLDWQASETIEEGTITYGFKYSSAMWPNPPAGTPTTTNNKTIDLTAGDASGTAELKDIVAYVYPSGAFNYYYYATLNFRIGTEWFTKELDFLTYSYRNDLKQSVHITSVSPEPCSNNIADNFDLTLATDYPIVRNNVLNRYYDYSYDYDPYSSDFGTSFNFNIYHDTSSPIHIHTFLDYRSCNYQALPNVIGIITYNCDRANCTCKLACDDDSGQNGYFCFNGNYISYSSGNTASANKAPAILTQDDKTGTISYAATAETLTPNPTDPGQAQPLSVDSFVQYGTDSKNLSSTYRPKTKAALQKVTLPDLKTRTYYYQIVSTDNDGAKHQSEIKTLKHGNGLVRFFSDLWQKIKSVF